jgi:voltage-gated potassium channel
MMTRIIVYFAYYLKSSKQYKTSKQFLWELMENEGSQLKVYFDRIMMAFICFSIYMIIYDIGHKNNAYSPYIETSVFIVFSIASLFNAVHHLPLNPVQPYPLLPLLTPFDIIFSPK